MNQKLELLQKQNEQAIHCGGEKAVAKQHSLGKYTARERIEKFLDAGSFHETGRFVTHRCTDFNMSEKVIPADGVITGYGTVNGRKVFVYAQDFTASGGSMGKMQAEKICALMDLASEAGAPLIAMHDSGGARIQEGVDALSGYGNIFRRNAMNSGKIPQIALMMGPCAGGATYSPALMDFIIMVDQESKMFVTGPSVVKSISGEDVTADQLGGASIHAAKSGVSHFLVKNDDEALEYAKQLLGYLPDNCNNKPQTVPYLMNRDSVYINQVIPDEWSQYRHRCQSAFGQRWVS
jgi:acetyl-CoA carboxylase carboxyltransferase component